MDKFNLPTPLNPFEIPEIDLNYGSIKIKDFSLFEQVDYHVFENSPKNYSSFKEFIWRLIYSKNFSQLEKVRVIFRFITHTYISEQSFDTRDPNSPEQKMVELISEQNYVANLFSFLCSYAGIPSAVVSGYVKCSPDYIPGEVLYKNHQWNAVYIDKCWNLIDCYYAGGLDSYQREINNYYFLMDPYKAIYSHYPAEDKWQLLKSTMSLNRFQSLPIISPQFFKSGLTISSIVSDTDLDLNCDNCIYRFDYCSLSDFSHTIEMLDENSKSTTSDYQGVDLTSFGCLETIDFSVRLYLRFPVSGSYIITIKSRLLSEQDAERTQALKFKIVVRKSSDTPIEELVFPDSNFGWNYLNSIKHGLKFNPSSRATIYSNKCFTILVNKDRYKTSLTVEFQKFNESASSDYIFIDEASNETKIEFKPELDGEYSLRVYANSGYGDRELVAQYFCEKRSSKTTPLRFITPTIGGDDYKLPDPYFSSNKLALENLNQEFFQLFSFLRERNSFRMQNSTQSTKADLEDDGFDFCKELQADRRSSKSESCFLQRLSNRQNDSGSYTKNPSNSKDREFKENIENSPIPETYDALFEKLASFYDWSDEKEKLRSFFVWVTYQINSVDENSTFPNKTPGCDLTKLKNNSMAYSEIVKYFCDKVNIKCEIIKGISKGYNYRPGMKMETGDKTLHHSWNAVSINDTWYLVDCLWSSRRIVHSQSDQNQKLDYYLDDYFLYTNPSELIYSHFPFDSQWQLFDEPVTLNDFESAAPVKPIFFKMKLNLQSHTKGRIYTEEPFLNIQIGLPMDINQNTDIDCVLKDPNSNIISQYCIHELIFEEDNPFENFYLRFPSDGDYIFSVILYDHEHKVYQSSIDYCINVKMFGEIFPQPFPNSITKRYGPTEFAFKVGINALKYNSAIVPKMNECVDLIFSIPEERFNSQNFHCILKNNDQPTDSLDKLTLIRFVKTYDCPNHHFLIATIFHQAGEYALEVYFQDTEFGEENSYKLIWQFLLQVGSVCKMTNKVYFPYTVLKRSKKLEDYEIMLMTHCDPYIRVHSKPNEDCQPIADVCVDLRYCNYKNVRLIPQLFDFSDLENKNYSNFILQQYLTDSQIVRFLVRFPKPGIFTMPIFYQELYDYESKPSLLYAYMFNVCHGFEHSKVRHLRGQVCGEFPEQTNKWRDGCRLSEPLTQLIPSKQMDFSVIVPEARDILLLKEDNTCIGTLENTGSDHEARWEKTIEIPTESKTVKLTGRFTDEMNTCINLLTFKILEDEETI